MQIRNQSCALATPTKQKYMKKIPTKDELPLRPLCRTRKNALPYLRMNLCPYRSWECTLSRSKICKLQPELCQSTPDRSSINAKTCLCKNNLHEDHHVAQEKYFTILRKYFTIRGPSFFLSFLVSFFLSLFIFETFFVCFFLSFSSICFVLCMLLCFFVSLFRTLVFSVFFCSSWEHGHGRILISDVYTHKNPYMAMAITMRIVIRFFFATEVTQGPLSSVHYAHI